MCQVFSGHPDQSYTMEFACSIVLSRQHKNLLDGTG